MPFLVLKTNLLELELVVLFKTLSMKWPPHPSPSNFSHFKHEQLIGKYQIESFKGKININTHKGQVPATSHEDKSIQVNKPFLSKIQSELMTNIWSLWFVPWIQTGPGDLSLKSLCVITLGTSHMDKSQGPVPAHVIWKEKKERVYVMTLSSPSFMSGLNQVVNIWQPS